MAKAGQHKEPEWRVLGKKGTLIYPKKIITEELDSMLYIFKNLKGIKEKGRHV